MLMAFGVTEPTAGVDTSRIKTKADQDRRRLGHQRPEGVDHQRQERAAHPPARADLAAARRQAHCDGMTLFFTDMDRKRITIREIDKLGRAAIDTNELFIDNLEVADDEVVGEVDKGFYYLLDGLNPERIVRRDGGHRPGPRRPRPGHELRQRAHRFRPPDRQEPGRRTSPGRFVDPARGRRMMAMKAADAVRRQQPCGARGERRQVPRRRGRLRGVRPGDAHLRWLRYAKEYHIERLWREVRLLQRPVSQEMVLQLHLSAGAGAAPLLLISDSRGPTDPTGDRGPGRRPR